METFKIDVDQDGVALVTLDVPGKSMNTITLQVISDLGEVVERIRTDPAIKGAVLTSGKSSGFCAGADLSEMAGGLFESARLDEAGVRAAFDQVAALSRNMQIGRAQV